ncbi:hypothetical protein [Emticicia sp. C21]|uniref:hypothetical protein n=1 Tax=Emticicia sp. C21 TaxID=2302915 RepID=UPI000E34BDCE|nr:hypothetical protein [Emticicia sp. C21]RFS16514.1 hypothetical protein D0T08_12600 [Emticicia sp. C21]
MKTLITILLVIVSINLYGQISKPQFDGHAWKAPYELPIPKGWTIERFLIPISFAPQIPYKGVEDIRFTPGWSKATSDEYWSYAFLWYLDGEVKMNASTLNNNLKVYYSGLVKSNGRSLPRITPVVTSLKETKKDNGDLQTYVGTIQITDYMSQAPIMLNCKAHVKSCPGENKTFIFYELSPQSLSHKVWSGLDKLWIDFRCKK